jgi:flagellar biosynthesis regulator FlaF
MQIDILTKLYTEKKQEIFSIGRELIRHIISIGKSNIEIINTIKNDMSENYEQILSITNSIGSSNIFTRVNIATLP